MDLGYKIRLVAPEGLEYIDEHDIYRFGVSILNKAWVVTLPGSKGKYYETHEMSEEERARILPRIEKHLAARRYFGLVGRRYPVTFQHEGPISAEMQERRDRAVEVFKRRERDAGR
jgi:hypothetical protein